MFFLERNDMDLFKKTFGYIISYNSIEDSLIDVGQILSSKGMKTSRQDCLEILKNHKINSLQKFKPLALKLVFLFIKISLKDNLISDEELKSIRFLKLLFDIEEGDFLNDKHLSKEVSSIIKLQLDLMYQDDNYIDKDESIHKVNLQEAFGLNYDEFAQLGNQAALDALERGADWVELDTYITGDEYEKWCNAESFDSISDSVDTRSRQISQEVKDSVWNRDGGVCVECGSNENIEFDHIIPFSKGGANTYRNIQLLCENCNRTKSDKIG